MLYIALSPDQPPSLWPSPPTPTDGSCSWHVLSSCIFSPYTHRSNSHLPYEIPSCIYSLHSYVHPYISCSSLSLCHSSFLPVFLCIGTHITGRIVFPIRIPFSICPPLPTVLSQYQFHVPPSRNTDLALMLLCSQLLHPCFSWGVAGKIGTYLTRARARSIKKRAFYLFHFATLFWPKRIHHANPVTRARCIVYLNSVYDLVYPSHYLC